MYAVERQRWLVDRARAAGSIDVNDIAQSLEGAPETVRRDLNTERHGLVRRVHGGAVPVEGLGFEGALVNRATTWQGDLTQQTTSIDQQAPRPRS